MDKKSSPDRRKYLVIGAGGREHALCHHLKTFGIEVECTPGNAAIASEIPVFSFDTFDELVQEIRQREIDEVIVGPEKYLEDGIADFLERHGISCFGPKKWESKLETDKAWAKQFCQKYSIPTANFATLKSLHDFDEAVGGFQAPFVVKAAGLAAGKGVWIGDEVEEARRQTEFFLQKHESVVLEEFIQGREVSVFFAIDGEDSCFLGDAQDHKRLLEGDRGPNTGGMGVVSPSGLIDSKWKRKIEKEILEPCLEGFKRENLKYRGFLFLGLMIRGEDCYLLEFNCRMGDPETQVLMLRLQTSLNEIIHALSEGKDPSVQWSSQTALAVVIASKDYPDQPANSILLPELSSPPQSLQVFHSGTDWDHDENVWIGIGGRLVSVCSLQESRELCRMAIYSWIESFSNQDQIRYRKDIGEKNYA
jgi:phosphoribosylamine--glycine ligase